MPFMHGGIIPILLYGVVPVLSPVSMHDDLAVFQLLNHALYYLRSAALSSGFDNKIMVVRIPA